MCDTCTAHDIYAIQHLYFCQVVTGAHGVGKSFLVDQTTANRCGVINVTIQPGLTSDDIVELVLKELANVRMIFSAKNSAHRVIFWYRLMFLYQRSPMDVLRVADRSTGDKKASLVGAVRTLVEEFNVKVVVEGSRDSLDDSLLRSDRGLVVDLQAMPKEMIWSLEQLQPLLDIAKVSKLEEVMWRVLGGIPAKYETLWNKMKHVSGQWKAADVETSRELLGQLLCEEINAAVDIVHQVNNTEGSGKMDPAVTASAAMGIVLAHNIEKKVTLEELERLIRL